MYQMLYFTNLNKLEFRIYRLYHERTSIVIAMKQKNKGICTVYVQFNINKIKTACQRIAAHLRRVLLSIVRCQLWVESNGQHFEYLLYIITSYFQLLLFRRLFYFIYSVLFYTGN